MCGNGRLSRLMGAPMEQQGRVLARPPRPRYYAALLTCWCLLRLTTAHCLSKNPARFHRLPKAKGPAPTPMPAPAPYPLHAAADGAAMAAIKRHASPSMYHPSTAWVRTSQVCQDTTIPLKIDVSSRHTVIYSNSLSRCHARHTFRNTHAVHAFKGCGSLTLFSHVQ